jgi:hypothetical protein
MPKISVKKFGIAGAGALDDKGHADRNVKKLSPNSVREKTQPKGKCCVFSIKQRRLLSVILGTGVALTLALISLTWSFELGMKLHLEGRAEAAVETPVK